MVGFTPRWTIDAVLLITRALRYVVRILYPTTATSFRKNGDKSVLTSRNAPALLGLIKSAWHILSVVAVCQH